MTICKKYYSIQVQILTKMSISKIFKTEYVWKVIGMYADQFQVTKNCQNY